MCASSVDAAYGALLGAFVGDACGAVLEFDSKISSETVDRALTMPGGGLWGVGPGQITDDSELALALASGLSPHDPADGFPDEAVAQAYGAWLASQPFDVGNTCLTAFSAAKRHHPSSGSLAQAMRQQSKFSAESQSNGALMRVAPLAVWGCRLGDEQLAAAATADALLTHPHPVAHHANAAYCLALKHLIGSPGDAEGAAAAATAWLAGHPCSEVSGWLADALGSGPGPDANHNIGHVRHAFFYAFRHLSTRTPYRAALREVLLLKGDTDTNAAIVGGMLGALHGAAAVPYDMAAPLLARAGQQAGAASKGPKRPGWLQPGRLPAVFAELYGRATGEAVDVRTLAGAGVPAVEAVGGVAAAVEEVEAVAAVVVGSGGAGAIVGDEWAVAGADDEGHRGERTN